MSNQTHCSQCGATVAPGAPFCPRCGTELPGRGASGNLKEGPATGAVGSQPLPPPPPPPPAPSARKPAGSGGLSTSDPANFVQPGMGQKPWPFSSEALAQQLAASGYVTKQVVDALLAEATAAGRTLPEKLIESKQMSPEILRDAMSRVFGLPIADLRQASIDPRLVATFPSAAARENIYLPLHREGTRLIMVVWDPTNAEAIRAVRRTVGLTIDMRLATQSELAPIVHQYFSATLVVLLPSGETLNIAVPHGEIKIGKSDQNDLVLADPTVSSTHAILRAHGDDYQIVDFGSRNGIFVGGNRVSGSHLLRNGEVIQIGQCLLTFKLPIPEAAQSDTGGTQILSPAAIHSPLKGLPLQAAVGGITPVAAPGVPTPAAPKVKTEEDEEKKEKKKKKKKGGAGDEKLKAAWIGFVGRIVAQIVAVLFALFISLLATGKLGTACATSQTNANETPPAGVEAVTPVLYGENNPATNMEFNTSGIVPVGDSKFLLVENNTNDALYQLELSAEGTKTRPLEKRPLVGLAQGSIDDMEGLTTVTENGQQYIFAVSSLMTKEKKGIVEPLASGLLRIVPDAYGALKAENMPGFRDWVIKNCSEIGGAAGIEPDEGGLNIEGLAWDPKRRALLLGVRTPVQGGKPLVVPLKVKDIAGPWTTANLEAMPAIRLAVEQGGEEQGIRDIQFDPSRNLFWVLVGNSTSGPLGSNAPFKLYTWDGGDSGTVALLKNVFFAKKMKAEGVTHGTVGGKGAVIIADDAGGYAILYDDDSRLTA